MRARLAANAGFTYVWILLAIAFMAAGLAAITELASTAMRRDKEAELLFVGDQFARAIAAYRASSPGSQQYPQRLEDLLADKRFPNVRRHLRRVYPDPITGGADWGLVRGPGGGIVGVYSRSTTKPLKAANFPKGYEAFGNAASYAEWRFVAGTDGKISAATSAARPGAPGTLTSPGAPGTLTSPGAPGTLTSPGAPGTLTSPGAPGTLTSPGAFGTLTPPTGTGSLAPPTVTLESAAPRPAVPAPRQQ